MSTRCMIEFTDSWSWQNEASTQQGKPPTATVYQHCDGYPDGPTGVIANMARFFEEIEKLPRRRWRYSDAEEVAGRFIVWQAMQLTKDKNYSESPLDFDGLGPTTLEHGDIAYIYRVHCSDTDRRPTVSVKG